MIALKTVPLRNHGSCTSDAGCLCLGGKDRYVDRWPVARRTVFHALLCIQELMDRLLCIPSQRASFVLGTRQRRIEGRKQELWVVMGQASEVVAAQERGLVELRVLWSDGLDGSYCPCLLSSL